MRFLRRHLIAVFILRLFLANNSFSETLNSSLHSKQAIPRSDIKVPSVVSNDPLDKPTVYFLSGLGADKRVFSKLDIDPRYVVKHIEWSRPEKKESLHHYAERLVSQIDTTKPFSLVGLSFGGIIASELSDIVHPQKVIIISSTSTGIPISPFYRGLVKVLLFHPLSAPILKSANSLTYKFFGADTPELKSLLKDILHDTDPKFLKWALIQLSGWDRKSKTEGLYHIHGSADKLISIKLVKPDAVVAGGGHLMVYKEHIEISSLINKQLP